jgi:hypothetical protein
MSRPRILYVLSSLAANDLGDEIVTILGRLSRSKFEPAVVSLGGREDLERRIDELQVSQRTLGLAGAVGALGAVGKVRRLISETGPDVVHGFGSWGGSVAQLAAPKDVAVVRSVTRPPTHERDLRGLALRHLKRRASLLDDVRRHGEGVVQEVDAARVADELGDLYRSLDA